MSRSRGYGACVSRSWRRFLENWPRKDWTIFLRSECRNGSHPSFQRRSTDPPSSFVPLFSGFTVRHIYFAISPNKLKSGSSVLESASLSNFLSKYFQVSHFCKLVLGMFRNPSVEDLQADWKSDVVSSDWINYRCISTLEKSVFQFCYWLSF